MAVEMLVMMISVFDSMLISSSVLRMETVCFSETLVPTYETKLKLSHYTP
jgi:hypothetical protein